MPHQGSLYRIEASPTSESPLSYRYAIEIALENGDTHELIYEPQHFEFMSRLFAILDTESRGLVGRAVLMEFVTLRCPVFWRRDEDLRKLQPSFTNDGTSPTFDEVWAAVSQCSSTPVEGYSTAELGVEGWMIFCRFIALAQYLEAKRQFSSRHSQQTMRHKNAPRGSELVVVNVPPPSHRLLCLRRSWRITREEGNRRFLYQSLTWITVLWQLMTRFDEDESLLDTLVPSRFQCLDHLV